GLFLYAHMAQKLLSVRQKSRQPLTRLPADRMNTVIWIFREAKSAFGYLCCKDRIHQRRVGSFAKSGFAGSPGCQSRLWLPVL
ncbi:MAG: hypothetical protein U0L60_07205, partial [Ruminococcus sp.]|nr:hypothetical protein [Ruminococcus sp.]